MEKNESIMTAWSSMHPSRDKEWFAYQFGTVSSTAEGHILKSPYPLTSGKQVIQNSMAFSKDTWSL